jgi:transcriptional regulator with XRE-family HTH domain
MAARNKIGVAEERRRIGRRIRRRRLLLSMTQNALAGALGVTFQQVQKYENGTSPVPERRLISISRCLDVAPDYFSDRRAELADNFDQFVQSPEGIALYRALALIPDVAIRARLIMAVEAFSDSEVRPEESDAGLLSAWLGRIARDGDSDRHKENVAAGIRAAKVELALLIGKTLKARKLTQKFAARILRTDQARISALARGNVEATSFEKLLRYLVLLGWNAHIAIARRPANASGKVKITKGNEP